MIKDFIIGDLHLDAKVGKKFAFNFFDKTVDMIIEQGKKYDRTVLLGDYFENPNPSNSIRAKFSSFVSRLKNPILILGNHDINIDGNVLQVIKPLSNKYQIIEDHYEDGEGCLFISYRKNQQEIEELIKSKDCKTIYGHFDINGYKLGRLGDDGKDYFKENQSRINLKAKGKKLILGHVHQQQDKDNVVYIGSLFPTDLSEIIYKFRIAFNNNEILSYKELDYGLENYVIDKPEQLDEIMITENTSFIINIKDIKEKFEYLNKIDKYLSIKFVINKTIKSQKKKISGSMNFNDTMDEYLKIIDKENLKEKILKYVEENR